MQHPKQYFQLELVNLTRITGLRLMQVSNPAIEDDGENDDDDYNSDASFGMWLMYSIDGCKWKIFGARPKLPQVTTSNATNGTSINPELKQV